MTTLEKQNKKISSSKQGFESKLILYEDNIPRRGEGPANFMQTGIPIHDVYFDQEGRRIDQYQSQHEDDQIVGVFGDSFTEALQVRQYEDYSSLTENALRNLGYRVDFQNYGLGATGTSVHYSRYQQLKKKGKRFYAVVLTMLLSNDIADNHPLINGPFEHYQSYPYYEYRDGTLVRQDKVSRIYEREGIKSFLKNYSHLASALNNARQILKIKRHPLSPEMDKSIYDFVCEAPVSQEWEEAWSITEDILQSWKKEADQSQEKFLLIIFANMLGEMNEESRQQTDCDYARKRMLKFAQSQNINAIDFDLIAKSYIIDHNIKKPYFSFAFDLHFNPLGHKVLAKSLTDYYIRLSH